MVDGGDIIIYNLNGIEGDYEYNSKSKYNRFTTL
jgi:hypothetical protein